MQKIEKNIVLAMKTTDLLTNKNDREENLTMCKSPSRVKIIWNVKIWFLF